MRLDRLLGGWGRTKPPQAPPTHPIPTYGCRADKSIIRQCMEKLLKLYRCVGTVTYKSGACRPHVVCDKIEVVVVGDLCTSRLTQDSVLQMHTTKKSKWDNIIKYVGVSTACIIPMDTPRFE